MSLASVADRKKYRRAAVVLLYAHLEGFCVFALRHFARAINDEAIQVKDASFAVAAAGCADVFAALRDPNTKCSLFRNTLPEEGKLHRFARDQEFVERMADFKSEVVQIDDGVVDSESNLKPLVLRKNLFRLGLPHDLFKELDGTIHRLLELRNKIAHGERKEGIPDDEFATLRNAVIEVMRKVKSLVMSKLSDGAHLRSALPAGM